MSSGDTDTNMDKMSADADILAEGIADLNMCSTDDPDNAGMSPQCVVCSARGSLQGVCAVCRKVYYCSKQHQREHWPAHRLHCRRTGARDATKKRRDAPPAAKKSAPPTSTDIALPASLEEAVERLLQHQECLWDRDAALAHFGGLAMMVADGLFNRGYARLEGCFGIESAEKLAHSIRQLHVKCPSLFRAGESAVRTTGTGSRDNSLVRGDAVFWHRPGTTLEAGGDSITANTYQECVEHFLSSVDLLMSIMLRKYNSYTRSPLRIHSKSPAMIAQYPAKGGGYIQHVDNPPSLKDGRHLTLIYYLNSNWNAAADGGCLCLFPSNGDGDSSVQLAPELDSMVVFWSDERTPHLVQPSKCRDRYAITVWFFEDEERQIHHTKQKERTRNALRTLTEQGKLSADDLQKALAESRIRRGLNPKLQN